MTRRRSPFGFACAVLAACATSSSGTRTAGAAFVVDPSWPKPLPNNWILGQVSGIAVDANDHVWLIQRPASLTEDEKGAALDPPVSKCCVPAPPVMEFDADGNLLQAWGGPGRGYAWPSNEHGIDVDAQGLLWVSGNGDDVGQNVRFR